MKIRLIVFVLSAAILGGSNTVLARGDKGQRYEEPRVQHTQRRDFNNNRHRARGHRDMLGAGHADRRMDRRRNQGHGWSHHRPRYRHGWSNHGQHGRYARRGQHYHPYPRGHVPARPYRHLNNGLSITFHGHF